MTSAGSRIKTGKLIDVIFVVRSLSINQEELVTSAGSRTKTGSLIDVIFAVRSMGMKHARSVGNRTQIYSLVNVIVVVEGGVIGAIVL